MYRLRVSVYLLGSSTFALVPAATPDRFDSGRHRRHVAEQSNCKFDMRRHRTPVDQQLPACERVHDEVLVRRLQSAAPSVVSGESPASAQLEPKI